MAFRFWWSLSLSLWKCSCVGTSMVPSIMASHVPHKFVWSRIAVKELFPIILVAEIWGFHWRGCTVPCCSDNEAIVFVVNSGACRDKQLEHLMRCLFFFYRCAFLIFPWLQSMYQEFQTSKLMMSLGIVSQLSLLPTHRPTHTQQLWIWLSSSTNVHTITIMCW